MAASVPLTGLGPCFDSLAQCHASSLMRSDGRGPMVLSRHWLSYCSVVSQVRPVFLWHLILLVRMWQTVTRGEICKDSKSFISGL